MVKWKGIPLGTMRFGVQFLATLGGLRIWHCGELRRRPAAVAPIRPLAWELLCAANAALKREKDKKKKKKKVNK